MFHISSSVLGLSESVISVLPVQDLLVFGANKFTPFIKECVTRAVGKQYISLVCTHLTIRNGGKKQLKHFYS